MRALLLFLAIQVLPEALATERTTRPVNYDCELFSGSSCWNFDEVSFAKVLLDSGIYQGHLKRGVPHGEVR